MQSQLDSTPEVGAKGHTWRIVCNGELQGAKPSIIDRDRTKMHPLSRALNIAEAMLANRVLELAVHAVIRTISSFHGKFP